MKLAAGVSARSTTNGGVYPAGQTCHAGAGQVVRFLLFGWLAVSTAGGPPLRVRFSVPAGERPNAAACQVKATVAVLPVVAFRLGDEVPAGLFTEQTSAAGAAR